MPDDHEASQPDPVEARGGYADKRFNVRLRLGVDELKEGEDGGVAPFHVSELQYFDMGTADLVAFEGELVQLLEQLNALARARLADEGR